MQYEFKNKKITVMGLGLFGGGVGVAQFLARQGARVTVTDLRNAAELSSSIKQLEGLPISYKLGGHSEEDFINADMVIVNPAVPKNSKFIQIARNNHIQIDTEMNIFFKLCPAPIIGITKQQWEINHHHPYGQDIRGNTQKDVDWREYREIAPRMP